MAALTVSQLNRFVKLTLEGEPRLKGLLVTGEISNCSARSLNGHVYFSLKDESGLVRCVMFSSRVRGLRFLPEDGLRVIVSGDLTVYERSGQYQLNVYDMMPDGVGALYLQFEQRKQKLAELGLFDPEHKRPLPSAPKKLAVISGPNTAALSDFLTITGRRWPCEVVVCPAIMQGADAPASVITALDLAAGVSGVELVVIARGGGSAEDLHAFNDERLAYAIYRSPVPVVSAIGHETDFTIADFAADLRASTPSAAAELTTPDRAELLAGLHAAGDRLSTAYLHAIQSRRQTLQRLRSHPCFVSPAANVRLRRERLTRLGEALYNTCQRRLERRRMTLQTLNSRLEALDPLGVLARGYAIVLHEGAALTDPASVSPGDRLRLLVQKGELNAVVAGSDSTAKEQNT